MWRSIIGLMVDMKPTTFVARESNEHNLKGIREYFVV
jgi:hypothetical protein